MPNYRQLLNGIGGAGGAIGAGTYGVLDQYRDEPWVGDLREFMHPDPRNRMGGTVEPAPDDPRAAAWGRPFDPEGTDYDYTSATAAGVQPDETGHWSSRDPNSGLILKGRGHHSFDKTIAGEEAAGYEIVKKDGRYYSFPKAPDEAAAGQDAREAAATRGRGELAPAVAIERRFGEFAPLSPPGRAEAFQMGGIADVNEAPANVWRQYDKATAPSVTDMLYQPGDVEKLGPELREKLFTDDLRARQRAADPAVYRQGPAPRPGPLAPSGSLDAPIGSVMKPALDLYLPNDASPLNAGFAVATGPVGGKLVRGGAAAMGALFEPDEAEAGPRHKRRHQRRGD